MKQMEKLSKLALLLIVSLVFSVSFVSCSDDDDDTPVDGSIVGTWSTSGYLDGDMVESTIKFKSDGTCVITENFQDYPEDNYSVTVNYSVEGDLSKGAILKMWGRDADGEYISNMTYQATISGNTLTLIGIDGDVEGETLILKRK